MWSQLQQAETWSHIGPIDEVWNPRHSDDGVLLGYEWSTVIGSRRYEGTAETSQYEAPSLLAVVLGAAGISGTLTTELTEDGASATDINVSLDMRSEGIMSALIFPIVRDAVGDGFVEQVEDLTALF